MTTPSKFDAIVAALHRTGQAQKDIDWSDNLQPPDNAEDFAREAIFVIANSGMRHTVAGEIFSRAIDALELGGSATTAFDHRGKAAARDLQRLADLGGESVEGAVPAPGGGLGVSHRDRGRAAVARQCDGRAQLAHRRAAGAMNVAFLHVGATRYCHEDYRAECGFPRWVHEVRRVLERRGVLPQGYRRHTATY